MKAIKSFLNAIAHLYSAWITTSTTVEMNADTELLKAVKNKKEIDKYFADFDNTEVEQVNQIIELMLKLPLLYIEKFSSICLCIEHKNGFTFFLLKK